jgi:hypothetical protein
MTPRYDEDWIFEHGLEDLSDLYGYTPSSGYRERDLYPDHNFISDDELYERGMHYVVEVKKRKKKRHTSV